MATAAAQLRCSVFAKQYSSSSSRLSNPSCPSVTFPFSNPQNPSIRLLPHLKLTNPELSHGGGGNGSNGIGRGYSGGGGGDGGSGDSSFNNSPSSGGGGGAFGILGLFLNGWRSRVAADPQFPFKVLMEELVGVTACVLGDMASRPNFGLNELDFVFSTLVVGSILNFTLMYLLAPTAAANSVAASLPSIFANCPASHMFEPGNFSLMNRLGTAVYKGTIFAAVGFAAGLVGTSLSNRLIAMRKKMDPTFETPNKAPPTLLNSVTWALHMGISSNLRYQTLNGLEFVLEKGLPPLAFKSSVVFLRCLNNVVGGMSFVILARLTGSQSVAEAKGSSADLLAAEKERLVVEDGEELQSNNQSTFK
ncbi:protein RETICULATA-RELATED 3, chloroplastic [Mercurialis annua]|uniref:protein RETICULATA-RELATED 3, chloroplastic n=1 Tax=Mercurialis annua TaxID=3986 RepID=UPI00215E2F35|nr:protein RETICULATA-RELATED 3, chloroplastic [Mercurialis annua]